MQKNYPKNKNTSWNKVAGWYQKITADGGHYYHKNLIIPNVLRLLGITPNQTLDSKFQILDLGCGNGVLAKSLPKGVNYTGIDLSENLIRSAKYENKNKSAKFIKADITKPLNLSEKYSHAVVILALQNVSDPFSVFQNAKYSLNTNGHLIIVLNHPMFRIPRQTSWGEDTDRKIQYRRVDKYMSPMNIPIKMNPSKWNSEETTSYHFPLNDYSKMLKDSGFVIELIEEWTSDKVSQGKFKKSEDRARNEIPLFMTIVAKKI